MIKDVDKGLEETDYETIENVNSNVNINYLLKEINYRANQCINSGCTEEYNFFDQENDKSRDQTLIYKFRQKKKLMSLSYYKENCAKN